MSVEPEDEIVDDEIELAAAEDYVPEERRKKRRSDLDKKSKLARRKKAETEAGTSHKSLAKIYRRFTEKGVLTKEEIVDLEDEDLEKIGLEPRVFEEPPTRVGAWAAATVNMGDFNSVKFGAIMVVPCYFDERDEAFGYVKEWVTEAVNEEIEEAKSESAAPSHRKARRPGTKGWSK